MEVDCVKFALGGADTATDALVLVYDACAATEATRCFRVYLLCRESAVQISEGMLVAFEFLGFLSACGVITVDDDIVLVELDEVATIATDGHARARLYESVERYSRVLTCFDCVDSKLRSAVYVATDEDVGFCRLISESVSDRIIAVMELDFRAFEQVAPNDGLTDCEDDVLRFDRDGIVLVVLRIESLGDGIDNACLLYTSPSPRD